MRVLLVDIDSLRPDHLGCYGYSRDTSPTIDRVAADGVRFENCFVSDSPCLPSRTALATGRHGIDTGVVTHFGEGQWYDNPGSGHDPDPDRPLAFQHLAQHGVRTASVSSFTQRHMAYHFAAGFQESIQPTAETGLLAVEDASDVTDAALTWLGSHATEDDWLLHVNYWDVHHPYQGVTEHVDAVRDSGPAPDWPDEAALAAQEGMTGTRTRELWPNPAELDADWYDEKYGERPMPEAFDSREDVKQVVDGYDAAIRKVDAAVADLLDALDAHGVREETVVIVTADHGEALGEHGIYAEHALPHPACQRVPLVVSWPGPTAESSTESDADDESVGPSVDGYVYQFDLVATLCDLLDVPVPSGWAAESFREALTPNDRPFAGREQVVCGHGIYTFGRALYADGWMYARLLHPGVFSLPGQYNDPALPNDGLELLHDLDADPHGSENLVAERPERAAEMRARMDRWLADRLGERWPDHRPVETVGRDPLAAMCPAGPYLYVDPDDLLALYHERDDDQRADRLRATLSRHE
ncbi:sulfatase [Halomarina oriensis]|uniref:Sulfatase-like hydrolase/transferase n=1 Tax=Halomarina oriensis TaxID=671145 RepID=A0A6B0GJ30_9EURY|nr:sulfatase [Halomarina oriensis]MWG33821.1 sulfatase-like hydrolase/transferase [Halomarina oriensis]